MACDGAPDSGEGKNECEGGERAGEGEEGNGGESEYDYAGAGGDSEDGADRAAAGDAEDEGVREWVPEYALKDSAAHGERRADEDRHKDPREAKQKDGLLSAVKAAEDLERADVNGAGEFGNAHHDDHRDGHQHNRDQQTSWIERSHNC